MEKAKHELLGSNFLEKWNKEWEKNNFNNPEHTFDPVCEIDISDLMVIRQWDDDDIINEMSINVTDTELVATPLPVV